MRIHLARESLYSTALADYADPAAAFADLDAVFNARFFDLILRSGVKTLAELYERS